MNMQLVFWIQIVIKQNKQTNLKEAKKFFSETFEKVYCPITVLNVSN